VDLPFHFLTRVVWGSFSTTRSSICKRKCSV
jgi:hypothetical protein